VRGLVFALILTETGRIVTLQFEQLLEVGLAIVFASYGSVVTEFEDTVAFGALHTSLVEGLTISLHGLHGVYGLATDLTFDASSTERHCVVCREEKMKKGSV